MWLALYTSNSLGVWEAQDRFWVGIITYAIACYGQTRKVIDRLHGLWPDPDDDSDPESDPYNDPDNGNDPDSDPDDEPGNDNTNDCDPDSEPWHVGKQCTFFAN